jgi:arylsulfatase
MDTNKPMKPNVLLICVDHWPGVLLGSSAHPSVMTPTLDQLASNGVKYTNAYSACPVCIPARRGLMTGTTPRTHGDRVFNETLPMDPHLTTMAQAFSDGGYQTYAVGKLHVFPQRDRIGFHDVILNEEGRHHLGLQADDYELFLAEEGYAGMEYAHGMPTTDYITRTWHLPEHLHHTTWTSREMSRMIKRRDPTHPAFWYMSFNFPHPPLVPLPTYWDIYQDVEIPQPYFGDWAQEFENLPYTLKERHNRWYTHTNGLRDFELRHVRRAFFAQCTHIDHQIRSVIGLLREEGLLDNTIICFTSDHGDMLGNHGFYAKGLFYEDSAKVPLILVPTADYQNLGHHVNDNRLVELCDIMPTLLDMTGLPVPQNVEGISLIKDIQREYIYGEYSEGPLATRMIRDQRFKLIYYAAGNRVQLFDLDEDPNELHNLAGSQDYQHIQADMVSLLMESIYGSDLEWMDKGQLIGLPDQDYEPSPNRGLTAQRGLRF